MVVLVASVLFFFFKQKTAYEMRISDWSSDVCSSDLAAPRRHIVSWTYGFFALNLLGFAAVLWARPDSVWAGRVFYIWLSVFNLMAISLAWSVQIGRASCRGRVCQYV